MTTAIRFAAAWLGVVLTTGLLVLATTTARAQTPPSPCQVGGEMFADVPASHPFCRWIEQLARDRVTSGCATNPLRFCPDAFVTRGQMAVFLEKVLRYQAGSVCTLIESYPGDDASQVDTASWMAGRA